MAGPNRRVSAASARVHTRKERRNFPLGFPSGLLKKTSVVILAGLLAWFYRAIQHPPQKICGSPGGPPITAPRIKLRDGRHLAYEEYGVPKEKAKYKLVYIHGFDSCRYDNVVASTLSQEIIHSLGVYILSFDRPGYGESDPNPAANVRSIASDVEELADNLDLGSKFYLVGFSMGGELVWSCLKYIPHRIAGAALFAPVVNYWWNSIPANISNAAYRRQFVRDQLGLAIVHYMPWLTYWWNTQRVFPVISAVAQSPDLLSRHDKELIPHIASKRGYMDLVRQQGEFESIHRDLMIGFGSWEFDPVDMGNPFLDNTSEVHIWHGDEDGLVPISLQRFIAQRLPWVHYHELLGFGHMFPHADGMCDTIIKTLLVGKK